MSAKEEGSNSFHNMERRFLPRVVGVKARLLLSHGLKLINTKAPRSYYPDSRRGIMIKAGNPKKVRGGYTITSTLRKMPIHRRTNGLIPEGYVDYAKITSKISQKNGKITHKKTYVRQSRDGVYSSREREW